MKITGIQRCCGVTVKLDKNELAPGERGVLTVEHVAGLVPQRLKRRIRVLTDDPQNPQTELTTTATVVQTLVWTPTRFELAAYQEDIVCPEIRIRSLDGTPFAIRGFTVTGQCLAADVDPNRTASEFTLRPKVDRGKLAAHAASTGRVQIDLAHRDYKVIYLDFDIKSAVEIAPPRIFVFNAEPGKPVLRALQLRDNRGGSKGEVAHQIESIMFKNGGRVEVHDVTSTGWGCEINVAIWPPDNLMRGSLWTDQLLIRTKEGRQTTVPVNVLLKSEPFSGEKSETSHP